MKRVAFVVVLVMGGCLSSVQPGHEPGSAADVAAKTRNGPDTIPAEAKAQGKSREPTPRERRVIRELLAATEQVRELRFRKPVPVMVQDRAAITAHIEKQIEEEAFERVHRVYTAVGLLDPELDVKALLLRVLGEQILGYFDPRQQRLVVRDDIMNAIGGGDNDPDSPKPEEARVALVHELVHALQSQYLSLSENIFKDRSIDGDNAFSALVEGDATLAMFDYMLRQVVPRWRLSDLTSLPYEVRKRALKVDRLPIAGTELAEAPEVIRVPLISAYVDGMAFVAHLHGKEGWEAVNRTHGKPPVSSEQTLHPDRFIDGEVPENLHPPALTSLAEAGYRLEEEETLGELETRIYFGQALQEAAAERAADGWGWDRLQVYRTPDNTDAVVWYTVWDDLRQAGEAEDAARRVVGTARGARDAGFRVFRRGRAVVITSRIPDRLRDRLHEVFTSWADRNDLS